MEKKDMPVIDFSDFPVSDTDINIDMDEFMFMNDEEFNIYEACCDYIRLSTSLPDETETESGYHCRREMENGELCDGTIHVMQMQIDEPRQIRWQCHKCGDMGAIINYENTAWDNSRLTEEQKDMFLEIFFSDISGEDLFEDESYEFDEDNSVGPFDDFQYYLNPYDPDGEQTGGPSSAMIEEMLACDWTHPEAPVYLKNDIPLAELETSFFFYNARQFLLALQDDGVFPLTRSENLKREVVQRLLEQTRWPENYIEHILRNNKNPGETDVWLLHGICILLDMAGLIKQENYQYRLENKLIHLLEKENAGQLYRLLFSTYYKQMNLGYLGSTYEFPYLQFSVPFILYKLQKLAVTWIPVEDLLPDILLFPVNIELQFEGMDEAGFTADLLYEDLFSSLERFSLIETRKTAGELISNPDQIRITPLFDKFIEFKV